MLMRNASSSRQYVTTLITTTTTTTTTIVVQSIVVEGKASNLFGEYNSMCRKALCAVKLREESAQCEFPLSGLGQH